MITRNEYMLIPIKLALQQAIIVQQQTIAICCSSATEQDKAQAKIDQAIEYIRLFLEDQREYLHRNDRKST